MTILTNIASRFSLSRIALANAVFLLLVIAYAPPTHAARLRAQIGSMPVCTNPTISLEKIANGDPAYANIFNDVRWKKEAFVDGEYAYLIAASGNSATTLYRSGRGVNTRLIIGMGSSDMTKLLGIDQSKKQLYFLNEKSSRNRIGNATEVITTRFIMTVNYEEMNIVSSTIIPSSIPSFKFVTIHTTVRANAMYDAQRNTIVAFVERGMPLAYRQTLGGGLTDLDDNPIPPYDPRLKEDGVYMLKIGPSSFTASTWEVKDWKFVGSKSVFLSAMTLDVPNGIGYLLMQAAARDKNPQSPQFTVMKVPYIMDEPTVTTVKFGGILLTDVSTPGQLFLNEGKLYVTQKGYITFPMKSGMLLTRLGTKPLAVETSKTHEGLIGTDGMIFNNGSKLGYFGSVSPPHLNDQFFRFNLVTLTGARQSQVSGHIRAIGSLMHTIPSTPGQTDAVVVVQTLSPDFNGSWSFMRMRSSCPVR